MRVHYLDCLILLLALLGVVTVTIIEYSSSGSESSAPKGADLVTCWTPAQFSDGWQRYTDEYCAAALKRGDVYKFVERFEEIPMTREDFPKMNLTVMAEEDLKKMLERTEESSTFRHLLVAETVVAVLIFIVLQVVITMLFSRTFAYAHEDQEAPEGAEELKSPGGPAPSSGGVAKRVAGTSTMTVLYGAVLLVAVVIWFILAGLSHGVMADRTDMAKVMDEDIQAIKVQDDDKVFMCDLSVRRLGNIMRYTIQCMVNDVPGIQASQTGPGIHASRLNTGVCFTIACLLILHLLYTLVVSALVNSPPGGGKGNFISDFNLALSVGAV